MRGIAYRRSNYAGSKCAGFETIFGGVVFGSNRNLSVFVFTGRGAHRWKALEQGNTLVQSDSKSDHGVRLIRIAQVCQDAFATSFGFQHSMASLQSSFTET